MLTISELTNKDNPAITLVHFNADKRTIVIKLNTDILYVALALHSDLPIKITTIRKEAVQAANEYCVSYLCAKYIDKGYSLQDILRDLLMHEDRLYI